VISSFQVDALDRELLQWMQDEFPITERPWAFAAENFGITEQEVLSRARRLRTEGIIRTLHSILDNQKIGSGCSTLIALRIPEEQIQHVASVINEYTCVTHNYLREHEYNLWFTLNTRNEKEFRETMEDILERTGAKDPDILDLRTVRVFKVDVRFNFTHNGTHVRKSVRETKSSPIELDETDRGILRITQQSISFIETPFKEIAEKVGTSEADVVAKLERLFQHGIIKRIGISVNQRTLGIIANAVVVWKVAGDRVEEIGRMLASYDAVTHCYERRSVPGRWEHNMFAVLHGYDRESVENCAKKLSRAIGIDECRVLFSNEQFKRTSLIHEFAGMHRHDGTLSRKPSNENMAG